MGWVVELEPELFLGEHDGQWGPEFQYSAWETDRRSDAQLLAAAFMVLGFESARIEFVTGLAPNTKPRGGPLPGPGGT